MEILTLDLKKHNYGPCTGLEKNFGHKNYVFLGQCSNGVVRCLF